MVELLEMQVRILSSVIFIRTLKSSAPVRWGIFLMALKKPRLYQLAWEQLKHNPETPLVISASPELHRRIHKAIIKEKNIDTVFHLEMDFKGYTTRTSHSSKGNALTITLHIIPTIDTLFS